MELANSCRKEDMYFRDTESELDVHLIEGRRNCLDNLLISAEESDFKPKAVQRVCEIFTEPHFIKDERLSDVGEGELFTSAW